MRISVSGSRGKSTLVLWLERAIRQRGYRVVAKVTGERPFWIVGGSHSELKRLSGRPVLLDENKALELMPHDYAILENQAITPYTMRVFNDIVRPYVGIITNIKLDHTDTLGRDKTAIADSFGYAYEYTPVIVMGENSDGLVRAVWRRHLYKNVVVVRHALATDNPVARLIPIVDESLRVLGLEPLSGREIREYEEAADQALAPRNNFFHGAKINDPESTEEVYTYLMRKYKPGRVSIVAYLRSDRIGRTLQFIPWLKKRAGEENVEQIILAGHGAGRVSRVIGKKATVIEDPEMALEKAGNSFIFTACNGVNPYMQRLVSLVGR